LGPITPEDFLAYCYAILAPPSYVETLSEELTVSGPRVPITKAPALFRRAVTLGRKLVWLHTFGERFVPSGQRPGEVPQGGARCRRGVPDTPNGYPETFSYEPTPGCLRVGDGEFAPVSGAPWEFRVSGLQVVHSWLAYRMKAGAGRSSSPLDEIRPERWTAELTHELLELLWVLEATVEMFPDLKQTLLEVVSGPIFPAEELPQPSAAERRRPDEHEDAGGRPVLHMT
jgi:hypothetical protein